MACSQIEEVVDTGKTYKWLEKAALKDSTEALIMAEQEQALNTRLIEAKVNQTRQDPRCRLYKEGTETVQHIPAGCKMLAGKEYMERHKQIVGIIHRVKIEDTSKGDRERTGQDSVGPSDLN